MEPATLLFAERLRGFGLCFSVAGLLAADGGALESFAKVHESRPAERNRLATGQAGPGRVGRAHVPPYGSIVGDASMGL